VVSNEGDNWPGVVANKATLRDLSTQLFGLLRLASFFSALLRLVQNVIDTGATSHRQRIACIKAVKPVASAGTNPLQNVIDTGEISWNGLA